MPESGTEEFHSMLKELVGWPFGCIHLPETLLERKNKFVYFLVNEIFNEDVSKKISAGKFSSSEMYAFFTGFAALLECGKQSEIEVLRDFLGSTDFRTSGSFHLLEFLRENDVENVDKIRTEIFQSVSVG